MVMLSEWHASKVNFALWLVQELQIKCSVLATLTSGTTVQCRLKDAVMIPEFIFRKTDKTKLTWVRERKRERDRGIHNE